MGGGGLKCTQTVETINKNILEIAMNHMSSPLHPKNFLILFF